MRLLNGLIAMVLMTLAAAAAFIYSGAYDVAADAPHWRGTTVAFEQLRERSILTHAPALASAPNLEDAALIAKGASHYAEMCTACHLAPGMADTELRQGLYPVAPKLAELPARSPSQQFWIIKHGLKFSGMPAWGLTHDDGIIWGLVAFVQKLPKMSADEYNAAIGPRPPIAAPIQETQGPANGGDEEDAPPAPEEKAPAQEPTKKHGVKLQPDKGMLVDGVREDGTPQQI